mmetsp:Transcript_38647/g.74097  ORF Transcript_38647/g.74097 Transcript_38647/m.74097 type:complete len:295 (+) Transcript_38647:2-886(+)
MARGRDLRLLSRIWAQLLYVFVIWSNLTDCQFVLKPDIYTYTVRHTFPHDPDSFTQGLVYDQAKDVLLESAGLYGESTLREVNLTTGKVLRKYDMQRRDFAEGLAFHRDRLIQLTWRSSKGFVYDRTTFELLREIRTPLRDGWGVTNEGPDSDELVVTDSGSQLFFLDANSFQLVRTVQVTDDGKPVRLLNELEWINNEIWANIWMTDCIARIDPISGNVNAWVMLQGLRSELIKERIPQRRHMDVLNGIAWDSNTNRLFVTGKLWPRLFEIELRKIEWPPEMDLAASRRLCMK